MNKDTLRMVIGFVIIVGILILWQFAFKPQPRAVPVAPVAAETAAAAPADTAPAPAPVDTAPAPVFLAGKTPAPESTVIIENDSIRLTLSSIGGAVNSAWLKKYEAELVPPGGQLFTAGLVTSEGGLDLARTPFRVRVADDRVTFTAGSDSLGLERTFILGSGFTVAIESRVTGPARLALNCPDGIATTEENVKDDLTHFHFYSRIGGKVRTHQARKLTNPATDSGRADWFGFKTKYFFVAAFDTINGFDSTFAIATADGRIASGAVGAGAGGNDVTVYLGPLEYNRLRSFRLGFDGAVSLGFAKPIALAILWLLEFLFKVFRNWGVAIIVFAIIMKAVFYPLTRTQTAQMRKMQQLQPKLAELKKKYKDDPQALNTETMQLYKLYKINPVSGCIPMLVQLPVFWALYSVLRNYIELRGASFIFWLKDLSQPDTLFGHLPFFGNPAIGLLPVLMGVSFIAQNMLTSTDKKNWAMTIIFPIFITAIFLNFPSGLQLYWFMYNVLSIVESLIGLKGGTKWTTRRSLGMTPPAPTGKA